MPKEEMQELTVAERFDLPKIELVSNAIPLTTEEEYTQGGALLVQVATKQKGWEGFWEEQIRPLKEEYDLARQERDQGRKRFLQARTLIEQKMEAFMLQREGDFRERLQQVAQHSEAVRKQVAAESLAALLAGKIEEAEELQQLLEVVPVVDTAAKSPAIPLAGVAQVPVYEIEVTDPDALMAAVVAGRVPKTGIVQKKEFSLFQVRESVIESYAKSMGEAFDWPGVRITKKISYRPKGTEDQ